MMSLLALKKSPTMEKSLSVEVMCEVIVDELKDIGLVNVCEVIPYSRDRACICAYSRKLENYIEVELDRPLDSTFLTIRVFGEKKFHLTRTLPKNIDTQQLRAKTAKLSNRLVKSQ